MSSNKSSDINTNLRRPIIGVLSYDIDFAIRDAYNFGTKYPFYISAAFVKWLESAGAEVIPIWVGRPNEYYKEIMSKINGVHFPGGKFWFNDPKFGKAAYTAKIIYNIAEKMNDDGKYFPIWGTTLGFQLLFYAASGGETNSRREMSRFEGNHRLNFGNEIGDSKLFGNTPEYILNLLRTESVASYSSIYGVTEEILRNFNIIEDWNILCTDFNEDDKIKFITAAEHKKYPFFGVMFRPQKSQFVGAYLNDNSHNSIIASQYFANFFVQEAYLSNNSMSNEDRLRHSIFNFNVTFVEPKVPQFKQVYLFEKDSDYPKDAPTIDIID